MESKINKTISIVTPFYNQEKFLEETIKSVLSQEGNFYIEYIIVDDGSPDNGREILKKYEELLKNKKYHTKCLGINFKWWTQKNNGQCNAINNGFKKATGHIWAWINSDDYYLPKAFYFAIKKFKENPSIDMIYGHCNALYEETGKIKKLIAEQGDFKTFLKRNHSICQPATFFKPEIYKKVGGLDENLKYALDYDLWLKMLEGGAKILCVDKTLANFRFWEKSHSTTSQDKFNQERRLIFKRYKGNIIDPKTIYTIRSYIPLSSYFRKKYPKLYKKIKKIFYFFIDKLHY